MHPTIDKLFAQWRTLETIERQPGGVPDYSAAAMARRAQSVQDWLAQIEALDTQGLDIADQVDLQLIRAETRGAIFNLQVLQPWARDPAFFKSLWTEQSDVPDHEGPTHDAAIELWQYVFPLSDADATRLAGALHGIAPLLTQARSTLTGNAADLWRAGIAVMQEQAQDLAQLAITNEVAMHPALVEAIAQAQKATLSFVLWLREQLPSKSGASGIGKENYSRYLREVHLVPLDWAAEETLLKRELARAHASLRLEEHRNRHLPPLQPIATAQEYAERVDTSVRKYMDFLRERQILPIRDYMEPALRAHTGVFVPAENRNFFAIARHHEPMVLWCHWYHWFEVAQAVHEPNLRIARRGALRYNIFDSRAEGFATAMEEMMMHAGLYDDNPRAREVVWVMLAQRAARGLASLYAHANTMTLEEAQDFHVRHTPRGWMRADLPLLQFEQHLYLRQPGYGTSYVTGKHLVEQLLADYAAQRTADFALSDFFAAINASGIIPVSLLRWELTGQDDDVRAMGMLD
ncbi:MAG: DUF885 family protein [Rhodoferax sp.]|nr:DUF885 family protein [Rhodoferax sp.]MBP9928631.1 DUF885 family protein [Rhodoferax sp.]HQX60754.1 DUF885 family protein [Burkholderiaceae bacterium]HQZ07398.1 DUF885 family protein [Burkholderiaceae bacterium]